MTTTTGYFAPGSIYRSSVQYDLADGTVLQMSREFVIYDMEVREDIRDKRTNAPRIDMIVAWIPGQGSQETFRLSLFHSAWTCPTSSAVRGEVAEYLREHVPNDPRSNSVEIMAAAFRRHEEINASAGFPGRPEGYR